MILRSLLGRPFSHSLTGSVPVAVRQKRAGTGFGGFGFAGFLAIYRVMLCTKFGTFVNNTRAQLTPCMAGARTGAGRLASNATVATGRAAAIATLAAAAGPRCQTR
jgi:hypothetical protein